MDYAFPSKLIEILASGVRLFLPMCFMPHDEKNLYCSIEKITSDEISDSIKKVYDNYDFYIDRANKAKEYIREHYNYKD